MYFPCPSQTKLWEIYVNRSPPVQSSKKICLKWSWNQRRSQNNRFTHSQLFLSSTMISIILFMLGYWAFWLLLLISRPEWIHTCLRLLSMFTSFITFCSSFLCLTFVSTVLQATCLQVWVSKARWTEAKLPLWWQWLVYILSVGQIAHTFLSNETWQHSDQKWCSCINLSLKAAYTKTSSC